MLGEKLRSARNGAGLTLMKAAEAVGISHSYLSNIETGKVLPSYDKLLILAELYRVPTAELVAIEAVERGRLPLTPDVSVAVVLAAMKVLAESSSMPSVEPPESKPSSFSCPHCGKGCTVCPE